MVRSTQTDRPVNVAAHLEMQSDFFFSVFCFFKYKAKKKPDVKLFVRYESTTHLWKISAGDQRADVQHQLPTC